MQVQSPAPQSLDRQLHLPGAIVVGLGSILLFDRFAWMFRWPYWLRFGTLWPLILVAIGVALLDLT